ncbi:MAG: UDP-N-acetylglucosamine diphosphorylase [Oscillospiraceae bacterium]|jgi:bifunctional UDP-N-acetylglucosamine pyrophosphorylase/glucosamine-1-phosphate N-acetyltransferase|nr:UDP-N-acetylglucosamine diphosphorylase [Oscillospiraceae bacterium]
MEQLLNSYIALSPNDVSGAESAVQLYEKHEARRMSIIFSHMENGVHIPCTDGVIISPLAAIGRGTVILPGTILKGTVTIGKDCVIGPHSFVENSKIGDESVFEFSRCKDAVLKNRVAAGPFAHIRPDSVVGDEARLGNFTEIKNSQIGPGTKVSHLTYVGDADVGQGVNFGCGVVTVNYDGKNKFRTFIDDYAFIGCNTNLLAPVSVGKFAYTAAGSTITEDVPPCALAVARARQVNKEEWAKRKQPYKNKNPE